MNWKDNLSNRELMAIEHAEHYSDNFNGAAIPGHNQFLLITKLSIICSELQSRIENPNEKIIIKKVSFDSVSNSWRDVITGVRVEVP